MMTRQLSLLALLLTIIATACKLPASPNTYFDKAALNANIVSHFGSDYFITVLGYGKRTEVGMYEQQVNYAIQRVEKYLSEVNKLPTTKDTRELLDASKDLFGFTLESYRADHLPIARMIDRKAPGAEVTKAMEELDKKSYVAFIGKYDKLYDIATRYAKDHDIQLAETPKFNR